MDNDVIVERLENLLRENSEEHKNILAQVVKTNGSVADIQRWRYLASGVILAMNVFIVPIILTIVIQFISKYMK